MLNNPDYSTKNVLLVNPPDGAGNSAFFVIDKRPCQSNLPCNGLSCRQCTSQFFDDHASPEAYRQYIANSKVCSSGDHPVKASSLTNTIAITHTNSFNALTAYNQETRKLINFSTDKVLRSAYSFNRTCRGIDRLTKENGLETYFLTLTVNNDSLESTNKTLNGFLNFLRNRFSRNSKRFYYAWVVELQKKRYIKSGSKALHWHFAIACPPGSLPDVDFRPHARMHYKVRAEGSLITSKEIYNRWGRGQVYCVKAMGDIAGYLGKYLNKSYESLANYKTEWSKLRRFGSSQIGFNKYPLWAIREIQNLKADGVPVDSLGITKNGSVVNVWCYEYFSEWSAVDLGHKIKGLDRYKRILYSFRSPWKVKKVCRSVDFLLKKGLSLELISTEHLRSACQ